MGKKFFTAIMYFSIAAAVLWAAARLTGVLLSYKMPTVANEPAIKLNEQLFVSPLKKPAPYSFIVFASACQDSLLHALDTTTIYHGALYLYRACGMPGDIVTMKNGVLFINNKNFDAVLNLKQQYKIDNNSLNQIDPKDLSTEDLQLVKDNDSAVITIDNGLKKKYEVKIKFNLLIRTDTAAQTGCFKWLDKNSTWTADNFGPLTVPAESYFVMGDNRHFAMDSRYTGFVKKEDSKGVVVNK